MLRKSAVTLAILTAMQTVNANALGLGEVTVKSALNQPLRAEINLLQVRDLSESQIIASLADSDDFYLAGVKPVAILSDLTFDLDVENGKGVIRLSSSEPIREPFLNFLVEVNWPSGRLVREYTVLLDPPVFSANDLKPRPVTPAVTESKPQAAQPAPVMPKKPAPKPLQMPSTTQGQTMVTPAPAQSGLSGDMGAAPSTYKVGKNDTLWRIAMNTRPDSSVSPQQMMLAIQRANPDAFYDNNINKLKSGAVLNIPGKQEVIAIGAREAVSSVQDQNAAWKGEPDSPMADPKKPQQLDATKNGSSGLAASDENVESQLRILSQPDVQVTENEAVSADSMANEGSDPDVETEQLENQLVVTLENVDKLERDNADLSGEVDLLNEQLALQDEKIKLQDQKIAELEAMLKKLSQAESTPAATAAPQPVPAPVSAAQEQSFVDKLLASPAMLGGGVAAILAVLLGALFVARKRRTEDDEAAVEEAMVALDERDSHSQEAIGGVEKISDNDDDISAEFDSLIADDNDSDTAESTLDMDVDIDEPVAEDTDMTDFADSLLDDDEYDLSVDEDIEVEDGEDSAVDVDSSDLDMLLGGNDATDLDDDDDLIETADAADLADIGIDSLETESGLDTIDPIDDEPLEPVDDNALDAILSEVEEGDDDDALDFEISEPVDLEITADEEIEDLEPVGITLDDADDELDYPAPEAEITLDLDDEPETETPAPSESLDVVEPVSGLDFDLGDDDDLAELGISDDDDLEAQLEEMLGEDGNELEFDESSETLEEGGDEDDEDVDYLDAADELGTKLDLARAYIDMDDVEGAKEILQEVLGSEDKDLQAEAQKLLDELGGGDNA